MKKTILAIIVAILSFVSVATAQNVIKASWQTSPDTNVTSYTVYYRAISNPTFSSTNLIGASTTNVSIPSVPYTLYELYVTSKYAMGVESIPSNKIRVESVYVSGQTIPTQLMLLDATNTNFGQFILSSPPSHGNLTGTPPSVVYTSTDSTIKDVLVYRSPEQFQSQYITNYYTLYDAIANVPPTITVTP